MGRVGGACVYASYKRCGRAVVRTRRVFWHVANGQGSAVFTYGRALPMSPRGFGVVVGEVVA